MTNPMPARTRGQQGSAYLIALMALFLLTILGISVSLVTQTEILSSSQERTIERTFYAAESGLEASIARALGEGDFGPTEHVATRNELEQGELMNVQERVQSSPFFCMGDAPCNLCSINQGSQYVRRNHMVAVNATRSGVTGAGTDIPVGRKSLSSQVNVEPMQTIVDCLAELPSANGTFSFDTF
jgi:Tfp pilus assembly protein PilX